MIYRPLSFAGGLLLALFQNALVLWHVCVICADVLSIGALRLFRRGLRWVVCPCSAQLRRQQRIWRVLQTLQHAERYDQWLAAASELDDLELATRWRAEAASDDFDAVLILETTRRLRIARKARDTLALVFFLRSLMSRSYGGIDNPALYRRSFCGTKNIIEEYLAEVIKCLDVLASDGALSVVQRSDFFESCRHMIGRTALALSGGGAFALSHMGVVKVLIQSGLLPRVISGTSGGAIVAGMMAIYTDGELLRDYLRPDVVDMHGVRFFEPLPRQLLRFVTSSVQTGQPRMVESEAFATSLKAYYGRETFGSAFARTGRIVNITITVSYSAAAARAGAPGAVYGDPMSASSGSGSAQPLLLNYLTSADVLIWSAVAASCALPGLMRPVVLMALNHNGEEVPFHLVSGVTAVDGSMASDIPMEQLALLFHCHRLIVSQANPHIVPFLRDVTTGPAVDASFSASLLARASHALEYHLNLDVASRMTYLARMRLLPRFFGAEFNRVFLQRYTGDITIAPHMPWLAAWKALSQPTAADMAQYIRQGCRAAWPQLSHIRTLVAIEKKLSACARQMQEVAALTSGGGGLQPGSAPPAVPSLLRRGPVPAHLLVADTGATGGHGGCHAPAAASVTADGQSGGAEGSSREADAAQTASQYARVQSYAVPLHSLPETAAASRSAASSAPGSAQPRRRHGAAHYLSPPPAPASPPRPRPAAQPSLVSALLSAVSFFIPGLVPQGQEPEAHDRGGARSPRPAAGLRGGQQPTPTPVPPNASFSNAAHSFMNGSDGDARDAELYRLAGTVANRGRAAAGSAASLASVESNRDSSVISAASNHSQLLRTSPPRGRGESSESRRATPHRSVSFAAAEESATPAAAVFPSHTPPLTPAFEIGSPSAPTSPPAPLEQATTATAPLIFGSGAAASPPLGCSRSPPSEMGDTSIDAGTAARVPLVASPARQQPSRSGAGCVAGSPPAPAAAVSTSVATAVSSARILNLPPAPLFGIAGTSAASLLLFPRRLSGSQATGSLTPLPPAAIGPAGVDAFSSAFRHVSVSLAAAGHAVDRHHGRGTATTAADSVLAAPYQQQHRRIDADPLRNHHLAGALAAVAHLPMTPPLHSMPASGTAGSALPTVQPEVEELRKSL